MIVYIRTTSDGRDVEVIDGMVCLGRVPESNCLVEVSCHPNCERIMATAPGATHMAGRIPLTEDQADKARAAMATTYDPDPGAIAERMRRLAHEKARQDGIE
jgi:hypothetical protein